MGLLSGALVALLVASGCISSNSVQCANGETCPAGTVCDDANGGCVDPSQLGCAGDGMCEADGRAGECRNGVCLFAVCGDGFATGTEQCDGADLRDATCSELGAHTSGGTLTCAANCAWDAQACGTRCGDGELDAMFEECEPSPAQFRVGKETCADLGYYYPGTITCTPQCTAASVTCSGRCGDSIVDAEEGESCDGTLPTNDSCVELGLDAGSLGCGAFCFPSLDRCTRFLPQVVDVPGGVAQDIWGIGNDVFVAFDGRIRHFDGTQWTETQINSTPTEGVWGTSATNVYATGLGGLFHYAGTSWSNVTPAVASGRHLTCVWGLAEDDIWVGGMGGFLMHWNGATWQQVTSNTPYNLRGIWGASSTDIWAVGDTADAYYNVIHYTGSWTRITNATTLCPSSPCGSLQSITGTAANNVIAVGKLGGTPSTGTALRFNGASWSTMTVPPSADTSVDDLEDVWAVAPDFFIAVGSTDAQLHYDGVAWRALDTLRGGTAVWAGSKNDFWIAEGALISRWSGANWALPRQPADDGLNGVVTTLWGMAADDLWAFSRGTASQLRHFDGSTWTSSQTHPYGILAAWGTASNDIYAVGMTSTLLHYAGSSWTSIFPSALLGSDTSVTLRDVVGIGGDLFVVGVGNPSNTGRIARRTGTTWTVFVPPEANVGIFGIWGTSTTDIWAGGTIGLSGVLYHYNGTSWTRVVEPLLAGRPIYDLTGVGSTVFAATTTDLLRYANGTWTAMTRQGDMPSGITSILAIAPDDVFVAADSAFYSDVVHFNGSIVAPVRMRTTHASAAWAASTTQIFFGDVAGLQELVRAAPW